MRLRKPFIDARAAGLLALMVLTACSQGTSAEQAGQADASNTAGETDVETEADSSPVIDTSKDVVGSDEWDETTHGKDADPDYDVVFPQDEVNTITISISADNWQAMQDDMTDLYGEFGTRDQTGGGPGGQGGDREPGEMPEGAEAPTEGEMQQGGQAPPEGEMPEDLDPENMPEGAEPPAEGEMPQQGEAPADGEMAQDPGGGGRGPGGGGMMGGGAMGTTENPMWVPVDIEFNGEVWSSVGMRFKGNSSLSGAWGSGILKLGFKLDFDEFEDDYPEIEDQRFYGFKQLSFSSNYSDDSFLHEAVAADLFREAGVPSAETAFYAVYVDYGEGPVYFGLYTAVEVVDDTVIQTQFEDDGGNVYKPEGNAASFAEGTYDEESFDKETNEDKADYSDVQALYEVLNSDTRTTDPEAWRGELEAVFNVDEFMNWLAVNTVMQNWDTYGSMAHNYYLYNDPSTGQLTWIPWDNNFALQSGMGGGMPGGMGRQDDADEEAAQPDAADEMPQQGGGNGAMGGGRGTSLDQADVSNNWPLIRYLMDDSEYHDLYMRYVESFISDVFVPDELEARLTELHEMIAPYVVGDNGEIEGYTTLSSDEAFETSLNTLISHINERYTLAQEYVASEASAE